MFQTVSLYELVSPFVKSCVWIQWPRVQKECSFHNKEIVLMQPEIFYYTHFYYYMIL